MTPYWIVVAFVMLTDGSANFFTSPRFESEALCEYYAENFSDVLGYSDDEIEMVASQCVLADPHIIRDAPVPDTRPSIPTVPSGPREYDI